MSDIISRLRNEQMWASSALNKPAAALACEAADEIERLLEIIRRMDGLIDSGEAALTAARQAAKEALDE